MTCDLLSTLARLRGNDWWRVSHGTGSQRANTFWPLMGNDIKNDWLHRQPSCWLHRFHHLEMPKNITGPARRITQFNLESHHIQHNKRQKCDLYDITTLGELGAQPSPWRSAPPQTPAPTTWWLRHQVGVFANMMNEVKGHFWWTQRWGQV